MIYVGDKLYGFCDGYFGRDSYSDKIIEGVGRDWIVAREQDSRRCVVLATFTDTKFMHSIVEEWMKNPDGKD